MNFEGINVISDPFIYRNSVFYTNKHKAIMHSYTIGICMLQTNQYNYLDVFNKLGVNDNSIDACLDSVLKLITIQINKK